MVKPGRNNGLVKKNNPKITHSPGKVQNFSKGKPTKSSKKIINPKFKEKSSQVKSIKEKSENYIMRDIEHLIQKHKKNNPDLDRILLAKGITPKQLYLRGCNLDLIKDTFTIKTIVNSFGSKKASKIFGFETKKEVLNRIAKEKLIKKYGNVSTLKELGLKKYIEILGPKETLNLLTKQKYKDGSSAFTNPYSPRPTTGESHLLQLLLERKNGVKKTIEAFGGLEKMFNLYVKGYAGYPESSSKFTPKNKMAKFIVDFSNMRELEVAGKYSVSSKPFFINGLRNIIDACGEKKTLKVFGGIKNILLNISKSKKTDLVFSHGRYSELTTVDILNISSEVFGFEKTVKELGKNRFLRLPSNQFRDIIKKNGFRRTGEMFGYKTIVNKFGGPEKTSRLLGLSDANYRLLRRLLKIEEQKQKKNKL
jgi:hypothetical protein